MNKMSEGNMDELVEFSIDNPQYDLDTVTGRFRQFSKTAQFWHAFYTNSRILEMQELIKNQRAKEQANFE